MFGTLFLKECRQILKSMVYYIYVIIFVLFLTSQMSSDMTKDFSEPQKGQEYYGTYQSADEKDIMEVTLSGLFQETCHNSYATYPMGFYKQVTLNEKELAKVKGYVEECAGKDWKSLEEEMDRHFEKYDQSTEEGSMAAVTSHWVKGKDGLTYEEFSEKMEKVCSLIGKGSSYEKKRLEAGVSIPMTYEKALEEYQMSCEKDRVTGAVARLFCDYAGIVLSVLPIFLCVARCLRDKRSQVSQVIYGKKASAPLIIMSRYLANVCMAFLPVALTAFVTQMPYQYHAQTLGVAPDVLAFLKYSLVWLLPEIMAVSAVAFCITEFTENVLAIFIQVFWAVASLFSSITLQGDFGLSLVARWNELGGAGLFWEQKGELYLNRGFYFLLSILVIGLTCIIYAKKRGEGETLYGKICKCRM